ncbi:hypothetical protein [Xanthobacter flavus]|uniref:hypothetical protein n=1 Tax=Xanthobacter flavus TaxID=281 RepID=UPI0037291A25
MTVFVWVRGLRGPSPQVWAEMPPKEFRGRAERVLSHHRITAEEETLTLDQLAARYPAPAQEEEEHG